MYHTRKLTCTSSYRTYCYYWSVSSISTEPRTCSVARTLEIVGEKWALLAVREVFLGNRRFDEMVRKTGAPRDTRVYDLDGRLIAALGMEETIGEQRPVRQVGQRVMKSLMRELRLQPPPRFEIVGDARERRRFLRDFAPPPPASAAVA